MHHGNLIHPLVEEVLANALSVVNQSAANELKNENDTEEKVIGSFNDLQQARCHWIQLAKLDLQLKVIQSTIAHVIENFKPMRLLWSFGKNYEKEKLYNDQRFHDYCTCFQTALKMIMEFVDEPRDMCKFIRNIGARHFFYNFFDEIQAAFNDGLATQRQNYLRKCMSKKEMEILKTTWRQIQTKYMKEDGNLTKCNALMYEALQYHCEKIPKTKKYIRKLKEIAHQSIDAVDKIIDAYDSTCGLAELNDRLDSYCYLCCTLGESPQTLWIAFNTGFANIITTKVDEDRIWVKQIWCKIARILEQVNLNEIGFNKFRLLLALVKTENLLTKFEKKAHDKKEN
ncbi:unnamed protein product [Wuchereria bancrofti]|uniref:Globin family profile domain-containing protein n=1 Tax=Wuchereria bancrofti TaxID=6293 RepID=A0A3P7DU95_WUCBA|nr:unnamed protein product [Wuchereria bancrofti]